MEDTSDQVPGTLTAYVVGQGGRLLASIKTTPLADGRSSAHVNVSGTLDERVHALTTFANFLDDATTQVRNLADRVADGTSKNFLEDDAD